MKAKEVGFYHYCLECVDGNNRTVMDGVVEKLVPQNYEEAKALKLFILEYAAKSFGCKTSQINMTSLTRLN